MSKPDVLDHIEAVARAYANPNHASPKTPLEDLAWMSKQTLRLIAALRKYQEGASYSKTTRAAEALLLEGRDG